MADQATALRHLKRRIDEADGKTAPTRDEFLAQIARPTQCRVLGLLLPDRLNMKVPPLQHWFSGVPTPGKRYCVWDQGGLLAAGTSLVGDQEHLLPILQTVEGASGPIPVLPRFAGWQTLFRQADSEKFRFIRHLQRNFSGMQEIWVTLQAREKSWLAPMFAALDGFCVLIPEATSSLLPGYEAVKSIHLAGSYAPVGCLAFIPDEITNEEPVTPRIQSVAKRFLGLDLLEAGMVLSGKHLVHTESPGCFRPKLTAIPPERQDFFFAFSERLLFPTPGEPGFHD